MLAAAQAASLLSLPTSLVRMSLVWTSPKPCCHAQKGRISRKCLVSGRLKQDVTSDGNSGPILEGVDLFVFGKET